VSYKFIPEKIEVEYPPRIKEIVAEYERHGFEWKPDPDEDMETFKEYSFEVYAKKRPETVRTEVLSIYRLRDEYSNDEWMLWKIKKHVTASQGSKDIDYDAEVWMGKKPRFDTREITDDDGHIVNKVITVWNMIYTQPWDPKKFDEILKGIQKKNIPCYIAYTSDHYWQNCSGTQIQIKDMKFYRDSTYDELINHDRELERKRMAREAESKLVKAK
jgi:hypothetical protein